MSDAWDAWQKGFFVGGLLTRIVWDFVVGAVVLYFAWCGWHAVKQAEKGKRR